ncbi:MerR family transcriptional regulator [Novosphingobium lentum]|uniref:MerR family transcriptional regulator n=1 Tax=Novosphingobium lentum TaxID=145287 RepID=UPI000835C930|nr:MerR family transcriptional regulator [Novosphingobium lentum]
MKMRELEAKTGVNRETIRVYFREGLLPEPSRPARNVADYGEDHVRAILSVRKLQRDSGMTLPQIKATLDGSGPRRPLGASAFQHLENLVAARVGVEERMVSVESMLETNPKARIDAHALDKIGVVSLVRNGDTELMSLTDAGLVGIWGRMRRVGFDEEHGFPPEIVDYYIEAAEYVAGKEARLFLERVEGSIAEDEAAAMLEFALPTMLDFFGVIRLKAFLRNIGQKTRTGSEIEPIPLRRDC